MQVDHGDNKDFQEGFYLCKELNQDMSINFFGAKMDFNGANERF